MATRAGVSTLTIRLLGHVALEQDGAAVTLASPRSTMPLLAYLLLNRSAPVARDFLAFLLAPDDTEESARVKLRNNLYRLTRALPPARPSHWIVADAEHVRWNPEADVWLDIDEFERAGRDPDKAERAIELYRGDLLATFYEEWVLEPRERYRNLYLGNLAELVSRYRRERNLMRAADYAQRLLAADPFREDVLRRLIAIRNEAGDRAGALREYQSFAQRLHDELGIEPMPETVAVRDAIARGEAFSASVADATTSTASHGTMAHDLPFVGRQNELDQLLNAFGRATRERGGCVLVGGEAGIGKSRLVLEFARIAEERGARVLVGGTGYPEEIPYQCFVEALRSALPLVASSRIEGVWLAALATLLPELGERSSSVLSLPKVSPSDERARLLEAMARCLSALAKARPLVVVLEDLQWAGESTLAAFEYLLRRALLLPILFIASFRDEETPRAHPLRKIRRVAGSEGLVMGITLSPLTRSDVLGLTERMPGIKGEDHALFEASDGRPLFLAQLVDVPPDQIGARAQAGLRQLITDRVERRSEPARTVAEIASLMGPRFSRDALVEVSGWDPSVVDAGLDELIDHRIVRETGGRGFFDYAFAHALVAEVVAGSAPAERAARRHRRIAIVLEELGADRGDELAATVARQYDLAGDARSAAPRYLAAARKALSVGAVDEAKSLAARGLELAEELGLRFDLLCVSEAVASRTGTTDARLAELDRLDEVANRLDDDERRRIVTLLRIECARSTADYEHRAQAVSLLRELTPRRNVAWMALLRDAEARLAIDLGRLDEAQTAAEDALALCLGAGDVNGEARARTQIAEIATFRGHLADAEALLGQARAAAARASDTNLTLRLLRMWFQFAFARRDLDRCLEVARGSLEAAIASGDRRAEADGHDRLAVALLTCGGRYADARGHLAAAAQINSELDDRLELARILTHRGQLAEALGDFAGALEAHQQFHATLAADAEPRRQVVALLNLSGTLSFRREGASAQSLAQSALDLARRHGYGVLEASALENLAIAQAASGEHRKAIDTMEAALAMRLQTSSSAWSGVTLANLALWYLIVGDKERARACIVRMFEAEDTIGSATPWPQTCYWAAAQVLRVCGEEEAARRALERAKTLLVASLERIGEDERETYLAIPWHQDILAATERGVWPDPPR